MASITSLMNSTAKGTYSNSNAITGLASGLDTESLIEKAVSGYESKIEGLQQDMTKIEWEQQAYRDIIEKIVLFMENYTSNTSDTNLRSHSFFDHAVSMVTSGAYKDMVAASGSSQSAISLLGVQQLAEAAHYSVEAAALDEDSSIAAAEALNLGKTTTYMNISGSLTLRYGDADGQTTDLKLDFTNDDLQAIQDARDVVPAKSEAQILTDLIQSKLEKLAEDGNEHAANIEVTASADGGITFGNSSDDGNSVSIHSASGDFAKLLTKNDDGENTGLSTADVGLTKDVTTAQSLNGKTLTFNLDGTSKSIVLNTLKEDGTAVDNDVLVADIQKQLDDSFGAGKVTADLDGGKLVFETVSANSDLAVSGAAMTDLGFSKTSQTSYFNTSSTLSEILGDDMGGLDANDDGTYDFEINGVKVGSYTADTSMQTILDDINKSKAGVTVKYSTLTDKFSFNSTQVGSAGKIEISGGLAEALFGKEGGTTPVSETGQDAIFDVEVDGEQVQLTRSSNNVNLDGLELTLKGTFGEYDNDKKLTKAEEVTFAEKTETDDIVDTIKKMVEDFNEIATTVKEAYGTRPQKDTKGEAYKPLTDADKEEMSETAIKNYEDKAKTGILFGDRDLSDMYNAMVSAISKNVSSLEKAGITTNFENGITTLSLNEDTLENALAKDADSVRDTINGFMDDTHKVLDRYGKTTGAVKGILIEKAGSPLSPNSMNQNERQNKLNAIQEEIEKWRSKLSDRVDYYTRQFTQLELLINQMNSQSSMLAGLGGGY